MEAVIKIRGSELNNHLLKKIKDLVSANKNLDITISINDTNNEYFKKLDNSIGQLDKKKDLVQFTMEEFVEYVPKKKGK